MLVAEMNWMQIEEQAQRDDRCVLPLGSVEQHAYLSLATDVILSERVAREAAEVLARACNFQTGMYCSGQYMVEITFPNFAAVGRTLGCCCFALRVACVRRVRSGRCRHVAWHIGNRDV